MSRKTMRMTEIRALANRYLAGSDPARVEFRHGVAAMYEHLAIAAGDYHGYNDIVQVWAGEPGASAYIEDTAYRRHYYGGMSGPDAEPAEKAIRAYRENTADSELARRRAGAAAEASGHCVIDGTPIDPESGLCSCSCQPADRAAWLADGHQPIGSADG